jgi:GNAT superfamily N-acetyltransferase
MVAGSEFSTPIILEPSEEHLEPLLALYSKELIDRSPNKTDIAKLLFDFPSLVAISDDELIGFAYSQEFIIDVLELKNILVATDWQSRGVGGTLLQGIEALARQSSYHAMILGNSSLYRTAGAKRSAEEFYLGHDYQLIASTGATNIFWKLLS